MHNLIAKQTEQQGPSLADLDKSINEIKSQDKNWFIEVLTLDDSDQLAGVYFQYSKIKSVLEQFGHMIFVDVTYNFNVEKYKLLTFLVADGENEGHPVGYAYRNTSPIRHRHYKQKAPFQKIKMLQLQGTLQL